MVWVGGVHEFDSNLPAGEAADPPVVPLCKGGRRKRNCPSICDPNYVLEQTLAPRHDRRTPEVDLCREEP